MEVVWVWCNNRGEVWPVGSLLEVVAISVSRVREWRWSISLLWLQYGGWRLIGGGQGCKKGGSMVVLKGGGDMECVV